MKNFRDTALRHALKGCLTAAVISAPLAQAQQFTNGSFEEPRITKFATINNDAHLTGWKITKGNVSVNRSTWPASDGAQTLELNGTTAGSIEQTVSGFTVGSKYILSLDYALHKTADYARAYVAINGENVQVIAASSARRVPDYKSAKIEFTAMDGKMTFGIVNLTQGGKGLVVDNVSVAQVYDVVETQEEAARFLISSTFGPTLSSLKELNAQGYSDWYRGQLDARASYTLPRASELYTTTLENEPGTLTHTLERLPKIAWFENAVNGKDQLRQRAAFALSQIFVTSSNTNLSRKVQLHAAYQDLMVKHAFGNFRDILHDVTYSPLMGEYLTYARNAKANPETGSQPDENYAREIMQLFTIGVVELDKFGRTKTDARGAEIETYDNDDITELAKVFTGLNWSGRNWTQNAGRYPHPADLEPMEMNNGQHSEGTKTVLGRTIPDYGDGDKSIERALDILFEHPNVGPFIVKQLIQRFTTSNPGPSYMLRATHAFNRGVYTLPDGTTIGSGERGDMQAVWAAVLFGSQTFGHPGQLENWGKVREPLIRLVHWGRVAGVTETVVRFWEDRGNLPIGGQTAYRSPSVFNFYRPGYVAPGSVTASMGYKAPELQIADGINIIDFQNKMRDYNFRIAKDTPLNAAGFNKRDFLIPTFPLTTTFMDRRGVEAQVKYLNLVLTGNRMEDATVARIIEAVESIDLAESGVERETDLRRRVAVAFYLATTSVEFSTQQTL